VAKDKNAKGKRRSRGSSGEPVALTAQPLPQAPVWQRALGRITGTRVCYGKPIEAYGHVVVPVATLRTWGGLGFGRGVAQNTATPGAAIEDDTESSLGSGGGGGGFLDARPVGFLAITPEGVRYQSIDVPSPSARRGTAMAFGLGALLAVRVLRGPIGRLTRRSEGARPWPGRSLRR
jgi:uncharacterized spore protein YtfJ